MLITFNCELILINYSSGSNKLSVFAGATHPLYYILPNLDQARQEQLLKILDNLHSHLVVRS